MVDKRSPHTPTPNCQTLTTHVSLKCHKPFIVFIAAPLSFINTHIFIFIFIKKEKKKKEKRKENMGRQLDNERKSCVNGILTTPGPIWYITITFPPQ